MYEPSIELTALFDYGIDLKNRKVFLQAAMEESETPGRSIVEQVVRGLLFLDSADKGDIELWIHTPGGSIDDMFAIYDTMRCCKNKISTVGHGGIYSAGALILAGGAKGKRYTTPNSILMVHEDRGGMPDGSTSDQEIHLQQMKKAEENWATIMGKVTKKGKLFWLSAIKNNKDLYMDAKEMIKVGVVDEIWP